MSKETTYDKLQRLHCAAVKAAQAWEAATPGTRTKEAKWDRWQKTESAFTDFANKACCARP